MVSRKAKVLFFLLLVVGLPLGTLVVLEGLSSLVLVAYHGTSIQRPGLDEEISMEYDAELGWVGKKSFEAPNLYGPGVALHTNARGFRGTEEIEDAVPAGKQRLICSGDSFTIGNGVDDKETWCALLATPELQTVNMGQGGYGIDQAYLWYKRDGRALAHDVQVLAFITDDFRRMETDRFLDRAKPKLAVRGDSLVVLGVPVPLASRESWKTRLVLALQSLRTAQLVAGLTSRDAPMGPRPGKGTAREHQLSDELNAVVAKVVADLARMNAAKRSMLVLVYLPVVGDFRNDDSAPLRRRMRLIADSLRVPVIDLIPAQQKLGRDEIRQLYIPKSDLASASAAVGHFSVAGNRWAAALIRAGLDSLLHTGTPPVTK